MLVLAAIDGSAVSERVLRAAAELTCAEDEIHVLTVIDPQEIHSTLVRQPSPPNLRLVRGGATGPLVAEPEPRYRALEHVTQAAARVDADHLADLRRFAGAALPPTTNWTAHVRSAPRAAEAILAVAEELGARLIAVGTRGRGRVAEALLGSVAEDVIRHAPVPVLVIRDDS